MEDAELLAEAKADSAAQLADYNAEQLANANRYAAKIGLKTRHSNDAELMEEVDDENE